MNRPGVRRGILILTAIVVPGGLLLLAGIWWVRYRQARMVKFPAMQNVRV
jgi:hypothetical protein